MPDRPSWPVQWIVTSPLYRRAAATDRRRRRVDSEGGGGAVAGVAGTVTLLRLRGVGAVAERGRGVDRVGAVRPSSSRHRLDHGASGRLTAVDLNGHRGQVA